VARPSTRVSTDRLREWARTGAEAALKQLRAEIIAIERTFPELALPNPRRAIRRSAVRAGRRVRRMSAAAKKSLGNPRLARRNSSAAAFCATSPVTVKKSGVLFRWSLGVAHTASAQSALQRRSPIWKILLRDRCRYRRCCKSMFPSTIGHCPDCLSQ